MSKLRTHQCVVVTHDLEGHVIKKALFTAECPCTPAFLGQLVERLAVIEAYMANSKAATLTVTSRDPGDPWTESRDVLKLKEAMGFRTLDEEVSQA